MTTKFCSIEGCESPAMETVPVSENKAGDSKRHLCYPCYEAYMIGMQHKDFSEVKPLRAILREFIYDVESVGKKETKDDWPDIYETYRKAFKFLHDGKTKHQWVDLPSSHDTVIRQCAGCGDREFYVARDL